MDAQADLSLRWAHTHVLVLLCHGSFLNEVMFVSVKPLDQLCHTLPNDGICRLELQETVSSDVPANTSPVCKASA